MRHAETQSCDASAGCGPEPILRVFWAEGDSYIFFEIELDVQVPYGRVREHFLAVVVLPLHTVEMMRRGVEDAQLLTQSVGGIGLATILNYLRHRVFMAIITICLT
jgi:hypothetical protein